MKLVTRFLTRSGIVVAVSAALISTSVAQAAVTAPSSLLEQRVDQPPARPSPDGPIADRVQQAIEEVNQKGQTALEELGELDSPEKVEQAEHILKRMEQATREVRQRLHSRESDRFDELNDLAMTRLHQRMNTDLGELGELDTPEKQARAEAIRARIQERKARLEGRWSDHRARWEQRRQERPLPQFDFRPSPQGRPPLHAPAYGLRLKLEPLSQEEIDQAVAQLEQEARAALEKIGEPDTPGKVQRAQKIRARLAERIREIRDRLADSAHQEFEAELEQEVQKLRLRAQSTIAELGELDTPEKQERARQVQARIEEQIKELRERLSNRRRQAFDQQFERQAEKLRQRAEAAVEKLGGLDTPEKQELARQIRARMEDQVKRLRVQLAQRAPSLFDEQFDQESGELRRQAQAAFKELGRLDTPEKIERARKIRARMEDDINRLKRQQARQFHNGDTFTDQVRANALERREQGRDVRARTTDALRDSQAQRNQLTDQASRLQDRRESQTKQEIRQRADAARTEARVERKAKVEERVEEKVDQPAPAPAPTATPDEPEADSSSRDAAGSEGSP